MGNGIPSRPRGGQGMVLTACSGGIWAKGTQGAHSHHLLQVSEESSLCCILPVVAPQVPSRLKAREQIGLWGRSANITLKKSMGSGITGAPTFRKHSLPWVVFHLLPSWENGVTSTQFRPLI